MGNNTSTIIFGATGISIGSRRFRTTNSNSNSNIQNNNQQRNNYNSQRQSDCDTSNNNTTITQRNKNYWLILESFSMPTTMSMTMKMKMKMKMTRLPSCCDEILDWTEDASSIFDTFLQRKHQRRYDENENILQPMALMLHFQPIALKNEYHQIVNNLSSMNFIDLCKFLTENVLIAVYTSRGDTDPPEGTVFGGILKIGHFIKLYRLLTRYVELLTIAMAQPQRSEEEEETTATPTLIHKPNNVEDCYDFCGICLEGTNDDGDDDNNTTDNNNIVVLPCSHRICSKCYERWVNRKLSCPYCRYGFQKRSEAKQEMWEMLPEWNSTQYNQQINHDIQQIEDRLDKFWKKVLDYSNEEEEEDTITTGGEKSAYKSSSCSSLSEILTKTYTPLKRTINIREEEDQEEGGIIIVN